MYFFYVDVFVVQNFFIHFIVLLTGAVIRKMTRIRDYLMLTFMAFLGSVLEVLFLLICSRYWYYLVSTYVVILPLVTAVTYHVKSIKDFLKCYAGCFAAVVLLGGFTEAVENTLGIGQLPFLCVIAIGLSISVFVKRFLQFRRLAQKTLAVTLIKGDKRVDTLGFYDSGNLLKEPYQGRSVHIISPEIAGRLGLYQSRYNPLVIPFSSLGSTGLLSIYSIDSLEIHDQQLKKMLRPAIVGIAGPELMKNKNYEIILNQEVNIE